MTWVPGVDVSHYQQPGAVPPGTRFAFVKASQGASITDKEVAQHHGALSRMGVKVGPYHYYDFAASPEANASRFIAATAGMKWDLPHALDVEDKTTGNKAVTAEMLLRCLSIIQRDTGRVPVLYTYASWFTANVYPDPRFARYPLWVARYPSKYASGSMPPDTATTTPPAPWAHWTVWQYSDTNGRLDRNITTEANLTALTTGHPAPHPTGDLTVAQIDEINDRIDFVFRSSADGIRKANKRIDLLRDATLLGFAGQKVDVAKLRKDLHAVEAEVDQAKAELDQLANR